MSGWTRGHVVMTDSTLYPTTDGFWPMGAYASFFGRLADSCVHPIDHNQEVWEAWADMDASVLPAGRGGVISSGLSSYGRFALSWHGRESVLNPDKADYLVFDDRTVVKRQLGVNYTDLPGRDRVGKLLREGQVQVVGRGFGRSVLLWTPGDQGTPVDERLSLKVGLGQRFGGNDFRVGRWDESDWKRRNWDGYRIEVASRSREVLTMIGRRLEHPPEIEEYRSGYDPRPWFSFGLTEGQLRMLTERDVMDGDHPWIACGMLPEFMDVRNYAR